MFETDFWGAQRSVKDEHYSTSQMKIKKTYYWLADYIDIARETIWTKVFYFFSYVKRH